MPEYDVDAAEVDARTEERTVEVPTIDVEPPAEGDQDANEENRPPQQ